MRKVERKHNIDSVFVLLLFAVFAGSILLVLLFGASSYEKLVQRGNKAYSERTGIAYITAKLRHNDEKNSVYVGSFSQRKNIQGDDINTLYLKLDGGDEEYFTKIYYYDGYIREVLCEEDAGLEPGAGNEILEAKGMSISKEGSLITVSITNMDGTVTERTLHIRSVQEGE